MAQEEAENMQHMFIGTEHVLIGLMREEGGIANYALKACIRDDVDRLREICKALTEIPTIKAGMQINLNDEVKKMLENSVDAARKLDNHYIGTEHLLLGIVASKNCTGCRMLLQLDVTPQRIRDEVKETLRNNPYEGAHVPGTLVKPEIESQLPSDVSLLINTARQHANQARSKELEPEHLLLSLVESSDTDTLALLRELGIERPVDSVRSAAMNVPKRKEQETTSQLAYSHATQTALSYMLRFPDSTGIVTPKDLLLSLTIFDWILVRLWSTYNIDNYALRSALARANLGSPPPQPRRSLKTYLTAIYAKFRTFIRSSNL